MEKNKNWQDKKVYRFNSNCPAKASLPGLFLPSRILAALLVLFTLSLTLAFAEGEHAAVSNKTLSGEVGGASGLGFAVVYKEEGGAEYEMWLPFTASTMFVGGYTGPDDLSVGDKVMVSYDETSDKKTRTLKNVNLIKKGEPAAFEEEIDVPAEETE
jgi:hypothetical protein